MNPSGTFHIVTNIATAATAITVEQANQALSTGGLTDHPSLSGYLRSTTKRQWGRQHPFKTADQTHLNALKPA